MTKAISAVQNAVHHLARKRATLWTARLTPARREAIFTPSVIAKIWNKYEEQLKAQKSLDFDDLVSKVVFTEKGRGDQKLLSKSLGIYFD